jgi:F-type H+-transporting ATPase subunit b
MEHIHLGIILAQIINFGIIFYIFKRFVADRLNKTITNRRILIERLKHVEEEEKRIMKEAQDAKDKLLADAKVDVEFFIKNAETIANNRVKEIMLKANSEVSMLMSSGRREVEKEGATMFEALKSKILDISIKINEKAFSDISLSKKFIEKEVEKV